MGALAIFVALLAGTAPADAASGATIDAACYALIGEAPQVGVRVCRGGEQLKWVVANNCRNGAPNKTCALVDGRRTGAARVAAYERSWVHGALAFQRTLIDDVALHRALLPHTHNSFNAPVYDPPTLTNQDPNQMYSITDQLRMDMRAIELDVHWAPSLYGSRATNYKAVTLCHGQTQAGVHLGCSIDRPLRYGLRELETWLEQPGNRDEFVLLYLENNLDDDVTAHNLVADELRRTLGSLVARPPLTAPCAPIDTSITPAQMRADGHRVLIVGDCGPGGWGTWVHERGGRSTWFESSSGQGDDYVGLRDCGRARAATRAGSALVRYYEDSTWLSATAGNTRSQVTVAEAAAMARCGVNLVGFDQLVPEDPRLAAIVWSWAPNEPRNATGCAAMDSSGRWQSAPCGTALPRACTTGPLRWMVTRGSDEGACAREFPGSRADVPRNGYENALLRAAAGGRTVRLELE